jgi:hypothetical protein
VITSDGEEEGEVAVLLSPEELKRKEQQEVEKRKKERQLKLM